MKIKSEKKLTIFQLNSNIFSMFMVYMLLFIACFLDQAIAQPNLAPVGTTITNDATQSLIYDQSRATYTFLYEDNNTKVEHIIYLRESSVRRGLVTVRTTFDERYRSIPIDEGGFIIKSGTETIMPVKAIAANRSQLVTEEIIDNNKLFFRYEEEWEGIKLSKSYTFSLEGKSLKIHAVADNPDSATTYYTGFDVGPSKYMNEPAIYQLPSNPFLFFSDRQEYFHSVYVDPLQSTFSRYEWSDEILHQNALKASNTPAWIHVEKGETAPDIECVIYCTSSRNYLDLIPPPTSVNQPNQSTNNTFIELTQRSFAPWPHQPNHIIRRWKAPDSGLVNMKGTFHLIDQHQSIIEVKLKPANSDQTHTLFTQALEPKAKPSTGIDGDFLIQEGDEIIFYFTNPAVLTGGEIESRINIKLGNTVYDSINDFSPQQGYKGWYYEQAIGDEVSPMVWNQTNHRWESTYDRSWQNYKTYTPLAAAYGSPIRHTQNFVEELHILGIYDVSFILNGWDDVQEDWPQEYKDFVDNEYSIGNVVIDELSPNNLLPKWHKARPQDATPPVSDLLETLGTVLRTFSNDEIQEGLMIQPNTLIIPFREIQNTIMGNITHERSERRMYSYLNTAFSILTNKRNRPLFLRSSDTQQRFTYMLANQANGIIPPFYPNAPARSIVDEDILYGRYSNRIGYGLTPSMEPVDPRFYPAETAMTAMISYGRSPYINGNLWSSNLTAREIRKWYLSHYALLTPVSKEYADTENEVIDILYSKNNIKSATTAKHVMLKQDYDQYNRLIIRYENGLNIWANRGGEPWMIDEAKITNGKISPNGFIAFNPYTRMKSFIGTIADMRVQIAESPETFFLNSVNNNFIAYGDYATDGMLYMWKSPFPDRTNFSILDVTEVSEPITLDPIIRLNGKTDLSLIWQDSQTAIVRVLQADKPGSMIDIFNLPHSWLHNENYAVQVTKNGVTMPTSILSTIQSSGKFGLRLADLNTGDSFTIHYLPQENNSQ